MDFALIAHAASYRTRVPFIHFFDGFRTSHEVAKIRPLSDDDLRAMLLDLAARHVMPEDRERPARRGGSRLKRSFK